MNKILIIVGPTGVGKTSLSVELAKKYKTEVISGDSVQVYKELNIGSAKVTKEEMQGIKHHLIDVLSYKDEFNVKIFQEMARKQIDELVNAHKLPIICGGTGLYIKSLYYDYEFQNEGIDEDFEKFLNERSKDELYKMLMLTDERATLNIHPNNTKRVKRALMRVHLGNKKSEVEENQQHKPIYDAFVIGLTASRELIYEKIDRRVEMMIESGLEDEMKSLIHDESDWDLLSLQGIGYKEWKDYFHEEKSLQETIELIQKNSRNFAKRQYTWFNHQMDVNWYNIEEENIKEKIEEDIDCWLKGV